MVMNVLIYVLCVIVAGISFIWTYVIVKEKSKMIWIIFPTFMNIIIILVLYTQKIIYFGLLGVMGVIPIILNIKKSLKK